MDALWAVADQVLSESESFELNSAEAFVLGCCFYVHDLGMALAATTEGLAQIRASEEYVAVHDRLKRSYKLPDLRADELALRSACRQIHAEKVFSLVSEPLPGVKRFLIENTEAREAWGHLIAEVAASHHWNLDKVHRELGARNAAPTAVGESVDAGYIACVLRVIDYAHINRERASNLARALRSEIGSDSVVHWDAQSHITGPIRENDYLVYACTSPIDDVDAWWLFYDLASGLDAEIRSVREYLGGRAVSADRFSLQGVKGSEVPEAFTKFVPLGGRTAPIDIRIQPHSMERVVELLGGKQLYGPDQLAPIRELIQNARDAIELRNAFEQANDRDLTSGQITVALDEVEGHTRLTVRDNGVGMSRGVVTRHLIGIGSDFWHSAEFYRDFGKAIETGFRPIGRFGIGFLSVFMLGDRIEVNTESAGSPRITLRLRGLGRRGELSESAPTGNIGTEVCITLRSQISELLSDLTSVVRARAPMLRIPITVRTRREGNVLSQRIEPGWWKHIEDSGMVDFVDTWEEIAFNGRLSTSEELERKYGSDLRYYQTTRLRLPEESDLGGWPGLRPQLIDEGTRVTSLGKTGTHSGSRGNHGSR